MQILSLPYDAQAIERFHQEGAFVWLWEPMQMECVLGAGTPERDVDLALCAATEVPVYRRKGGGGAVILSPGNLIITCAYPASAKRFASQWIMPIAEGIVRALEQVGVKGAWVRGLGDVAIGEKKILGSSLYANRDLALYQGSLLVGSDLSIIPSYLPHPSREPDYRQGRSHLEFVTTLREEGWTGSVADLEAALHKELKTV